MTRHGTPFFGCAIGEEDDSLDTSVVINTNLPCRPFRRERLQVKQLARHFAIPAMATIRARWQSIVISAPQKNSLNQLLSVSWPRRARLAAGVRSVDTTPIATRNRIGEWTGTSAICCLTASLHAVHSIHDWRGGGTSPVSSR